MLKISPTAGGAARAGHSFARPTSAAAGGASISLINRSGYHRDDLLKFFQKGLKAMGITGKRTIIVVTAPGRSRGCAEIPPGGPGTVSKKREAMVIAISPPNTFSLRRLARLFEHEVLHTKGYQHEQMEHRDMWSLGPVPAWAAGSKIRYLGRAPSQIP